MSVPDSLKQIMTISIPQHEPRRSLPLTTGSHLTWDSEKVSTSVNSGENYAQLCKAF